MVKGHIPLSLVMLAASAMPAIADYSLDWRSEVVGQAASGTFAPYYLSSRRNGVTGASPYAIYTTDAVTRPMADSTRFSYGFGAELMAGYISAIDYSRTTPDGTSSTHTLGPGDVYLQQIYGEVKYRSLFLMAGMKNYDRSLFDSPLAVGDFTMSDNARPIPQVRIGFLDFTDVPLTRGWLQVQGEVAYGKFIDNNWLRKQYNRLNSFVTTGAWMHYKRLYFRVAPRQRFTFTVGLQHAAQFGGTRSEYTRGVLTGKIKSDVKASTFFKILIPSRGEGSAYYDGNHLGSWDLIATYRFNWGEMSLTAQWPWEDGSGIGKLNGWDGIWGVSYTAARRGIVDGVTLQYIDMTNQSGPMHWAPGDFDGTQIPGAATGADDYYNNYFYDGWANYGMGIGTPFLKSPVYNTDGYPQYLDNRVRGFHIGIGGHPAARWEYRLLVSHRTSWGTPFVPRPHRMHATSWMADCRWQVPAVAGLSVTGAVGMDSGRLYGRSFGVRLGVEYSGKINFRHRP